MFIIIIDTVLFYDDLREQVFPFCLFFLLDFIEKYGTAFFFGFVTVLFSFKVFFFHKNGTLPCYLCALFFKFVHLALNMYLYVLTLAMYYLCLFCNFLFFLSIFNYCNLLYFDIIFIYLIYQSKKLIYML